MALCGPKALPAAPGGDSDAQRLLARAFAVADPSGAALCLSAGRYRLGARLTVPSHVSLVLPRGAGFVGDALVVEGSIEAGLYQIFEDVRVAFGPGSRQWVLPQWWGAKGDGVANDTAALQAALETRLVHLPAGRYRTTHELAVRDRSTIVGVGNAWSPTPTTDSWIEYDGRDDPLAAVLRVSTVGVGSEPNVALTNIHLENVVLSGGQRAGYGLYSVYCSNDSSISDVTARDCTRHGVFIAEQWYCTYRNLVARNNSGCGITIGRVFNGWRERGVNGILLTNLRAAGNGSDNRFHEKTRLHWGYGVLFRPGGGSTLRHVVAENNYGAGLIYDLGRSCANRVEGGYLEGNGWGAHSDGVAARPWGLIVIGGRAARANSVSDMYLHGEVGDERAQALWLTGAPPSGDLTLRDLSFGHYVHADWNHYQWEGFVYHGLRDYVVGVRPRASGS